MVIWTLYALDIYIDTPFRKWTPVEHPLEQKQSAKVDIIHQIHAPSLILHQGKSITMNTFRPNISHLFHPRPEQRT